MFALPQQFEETLKAEANLYGAILGSVARLQSLLGMSTLPFFPEYTDHGLTHISGVIQAVDALIPESARKILTPGDIAVTVLAVILHDLAMHLTEDGFSSLTASFGAARSLVVPNVDLKGWPELWEEFLSEARRFDQKKLKSLFGDTEPVRRPPHDREQLTLRDRKLIGEFVRRHHGRLAHEVALFGFPGHAGATLSITPEIPSDLADLAGFVSRSHSLALRECLPYLEGKYHRHEYRGVHAIYLMALLRIADYIQVQSARAPTERIQVSSLRSPVSRGEWKAQ